jgi:hypothetical protein
MDSTAQQRGRRPRISRPVRALRDDGRARRGSGSGVPSAGPTEQRRRACTHVPNPSVRGAVNSPVPSGVSSGTIWVHVRRADPSYASRRNGQRKVFARAIRSARALALQYLQQVRFFTLPPSDRAGRGGMGAPPATPIRQVIGSSRRFQRSS